MAQKENAKKSPALYRNTARWALGAGGPSRWDYLVFTAGAAVCYFLFAHPDIVETARHAHILLQSTFDGEFLQFFENVYVRKYGDVYVNAAHYNILVYLVYALWELPVFLAEKLFSFAVNDRFLALWGKAVGVAFYVGCARLCRPLAERLGAGNEAARWAPLLFLLNPISFFTTMVMAQYDSICLFFLLLALVFYLDRRLLAFSLVMGVGMVCKFFPLFCFIPLLLLVEKRPLPLIKYGLASLWLLAPSTLLFMGRGGDASFFNSLMAQRLFAIVFPGGASDASAFGIAMVVACVFAWLYTPKTQAALHTAALYACAFPFAALFAFVMWHPQWLILMVPFFLLPALAGKNRRVLFWVMTAFCGGFFCLTAVLYPHALEGNLLDFGALGRVLPPYVDLANVRYNAFYFSLIPFFAKLAPVAFYGALMAMAAALFPLGDKTLATRLAPEKEGPMPWRLTAWGVFALGFGAFWFVPTAFTWLKNIGIL